MINCKVQSKLTWTNYCVLSAGGNNNTNANPNSIIFTSKDTKLYVSVITLSVGDNQKLSKPIRKGFWRSVYWINYKTKSENKHTTNEYRYFLESNFIRVNRLFAFSVFKDRWWF